MEYAALALAALALIVAFAALAKAGSKGDAPVPSGGSGRSEKLEGLERELVTQRRLLAALAGGSKLTAQMVLEGRLWQDVDAARAAQMLAEGGLFVLDVRTPGETASGTIPGALQIPVDELPQRAREIPKDARRKLVYCAMGSRSAAACEYLSDQGFVELYNLESGFSGWNGPREKRG
jgi:rhodanese-related sulfurtransferase